MNKTIMAVVLIFSLVMGHGGLVSAACTGDGCEDILLQVREAVSLALLEKMKDSGTLDIYDAEQNSVRNLQKIEIKQEVTSQDGVYSVLADFRDINSGAVVVIDAKVKENEGALEFQGFDVKEVKELSQAPQADEKKEYSDEEIQKEMRNYFDSQAKFTGFVNLYDEENQKLRRLELIELTPEVRKLGVLNISRARFKDLDSQETLGVDITLENRKGKITVQSLRVRSVKKSPTDN